MANYKMVLCYDGSRYNGWQKQGNTENTIQQKLEMHLSQLLNENIELNGSGRTDAGVHALKQVASFRCSNGCDPEKLKHELQTVIPSDIGIISIEEVDPRFHARLNCKSKTYTYRLWCGDVPNVFERRYVYRIAERPNLDVMRQAALLLEGEHDFAAFCSRKMNKSSVRKIYSISITENGPDIRISYSGNGFLYNMVRILTGTLLEIGYGRMKPEDIPSVLASLDRSEAGPTAPSQGLFLADVQY